MKEAIHAPLNVTWGEYSSIKVFPNGDASPPPVFTVLPGVIEKSKRSVIIHGLADFKLIPDGLVWIQPIWTNYSLLFLAQESLFRSENAFFPVLISY